ncbi:IS630 family transposase [Streptomyces sp. HC307]|uniref:IS630 family transposase n=1 Tax=Streptomyces flavusporus TaxID=3385496 RepID=UPI003916E2ED
MAEGSGRCAAAAVVVDEEVRGVLERIVSSTKAQVRQVLRARIVLAAADGVGNAAIARRLAVSVHTVRKWRGRFAGLGLAGLKDAARSGRPRRYDDLVRVAVVAAATSAPPVPAATWTHVSIAAQVAGTVFAPISASQVGRILADLDLKPHKVRGWLTRRDTPDFWERVKDICELYRNPPTGAIVLSIDEKTAIQARERRYPSQHVRPGRAARHEFEYRRHGTASIVAALEVTTGQTLIETIERNNAATFTAFLDRLDRLLPRDKEIHVVLDNGSSRTAKHTKEWLAAHQRWHIHWTPPHASWLNQVVRHESRLRRADSPKEDRLMSKV